MKITKLIHSCLLVEMPAPVNRTALFDPGIFSEEAVSVDDLVYLDNIIITHWHPDHMSVPLIKRLVAKFPDVRITAPPDAVAMLSDQGIAAKSEETPGIEFFDAPHEKLAPGAQQPDERGINYLGILTDPGDSHSFSQTKQILALPVQAPWGSNVRAIELALELKPKYVIPIHDWHWRDEAREQAYDSMEQIFAKHEIAFIKPKTGESFVLDVIAE